MAKKPNSKKAARERIITLYEYALATLEALKERINGRFTSALDQHIGELHHRTYFTAQPPTDEDRTVLFGQVHDYQPMRTELYYLAEGFGTYQTQIQALEERLQSQRKFFAEEFNAKDDTSTDLDAMDRARSARLRTLVTKSDRARKEYFAFGDDGTFSWSIDNFVNDSRDRVYNIAHGLKRLWDELEIKRRHSPDDDFTGDDVTGNDAKFSAYLRNMAGVTFDDGYGEEKIENREADFRSDPLAREIVEAAKLLLLIDTHLGEAMLTLTRSRYASLDDQSWQSR